MAENSAPWPNFTDEEARAVSKVLLSNNVNYHTGEEGKAFEKEFAEFAGTKHAIAVANGTVALDLVFHGLGIGSRNGGSAEDQVIVTARSFMASVSSIINAGAVPVFADVGFDSQNIEASTIAPLVNHKTRAILCVHLAGWPCDMDEIRAVCTGKNIALVEDCAQAHGARYKGQPVGGLGDAAAWSFCQDKIMTTGGEGGMVTCNNDTAWRKMWAYKDHGKSYEAVYEKDYLPGFRWQHESVGTNWRLTEMQSAIGRIQIKKMEDWNRQRNENARQLVKILSPYSGVNGIIRIPETACGECSGRCTKNSACRHAWYKFYAFVREENLPEGRSRDDLISDICKQGFACVQGSCPEIYLEKSIKDLGFAPKERLKVSKSLGESSIMFQVHPGVEYEPLDLSSWM